MNIIKNEYKLKKVTQKDSRACVICFRETDAVLVSVDSKDWFYVCVGHLKDKEFATEVHEEGWKETMAELGEAKLGVRETKGWKEGWKVAVKVDKDEVKRLQNQLNEYEVWYILDSLIYKDRVSKLLKKKEDAIIKEKLLNGTLLPNMNSLKKLGN